MRLIVIAGALTLLATPAAAQRLDTRRIDVRETATSTMCGFNAYRDMTLVDGTKGGSGKLATWNGAPAEDANARMRLVWEPATGGWRTPPFLGVGFAIPSDAALSRDKVSGASVIIDGGRPIPLQYNASRDKLIFAVNRDTDNIGARVIGSDSVVLEILDSAGTSLRRYSWNTSRLGDAVETVAVVGWSCTTP
ncbi:MAG: hypothetical protein V4574_14870 [Pseudomonadota bacterium]